MKKTIVVDVEGTFYTHNLLWLTATRLDEVGAACDSGGRDFDLSAMLFAFFALEAYVNHLGRIITPTIWADERKVFRSSGTLGKLDFLFEICGISMDKGKRPYQTIETLRQLRDQLTHGRPESLKARQERLPDQLKFLQSNIDKAVTREKADRALTDVKQLVEKLNASARAHFPDRGISKKGFSAIIAEQTEVGAVQPNKRGPA